jgi:hypothetical protein
VQETQSLGAEWVHGLTGWVAHFREEIEAAVANCL